MTDAQNRDAERDRELTPEVLAHRLRAGEISSARVSYAAALGHPVALQVAEPDTLPPLTGLQVVHGCALLEIEEIRAWARAVVTRAGFDADAARADEATSSFGRRLLEHWSELHNPSRPEPKVVIRVATNAVMLGVPWAEVLELLARYLIRDVPASD